jgi:ATP-dependent Zn proteases
VSKFFKSAAFPILIVVVLAFFVQNLVSSGNEAKEPTYTDFLAQVDKGEIKKVTLNTGDNTIDVERKGPENADGREYETAYPSNTEQGLVDKLGTARIPIDVEGSGGSAWSTLLIYALPLLLFLFFWIFILNQMQGGGSKVMSFGKSRAKRMSVDSPKITFRDVAGVDEAVEELHEIKEFLENPKKFQALGARIPKGVCSTDLRARQDAASARAVAGEAGVPVLLDLRLGLRRDVRRASAPRACATSSSRPSRTRPASSSWTRSTPSGATAAPAWAAATTSASRRSTSSSSRWTASRPRTTSS